MARLSKEQQEQLIKLQKADIIIKFGLYGSLLGILLILATVDIKDLKTFNIVPIICITLGLVNVVVSYKIKKLKYLQSNIY